MRRLKHTENKKTMVGFTGVTAARVCVVCVCVWKKVNKTNCHNTTGKNNLLKMDLTSLLSGEVL